MGARCLMALDEEHAIGEVVQRLTARFPDVPADEILAAVHAQLAAFDRSSVRDFVPVLVEHETSELLAGRSAPG